MRRILAALLVLLLAGCNPLSDAALRPTKKPRPTTSTTTPTTTSMTTPPVTTTTVPSTTSSTVTTTTPPARNGCSAVPSACGYPDATNTGYKPTGAIPTTAGVSYNSDGDFDITTAGAVIDGKLITGCVNVKAPNVTITRSLIKGCESYYNIRVYPTGGALTIEDTEVDGSPGVNNAALVSDVDAPVTVRRMNMHHVSDGPHGGWHWLIEDSWIHDLTRCAVCHNDTFQSAGADTVTIRHNTLEDLAGTTSDGGMNAVVRIATEQGPVTGFVVENNLLVGGNYAVQVRSQGSGAPTGVKVTGNRIGRGRTPDNQPYPRFGPYDFTDVPGVVWSGNIWDDTGQVIP